MFSQLEIRKTTVQFKPVLIKVRDALEEDNNRNRRAFIRIKHVQLIQNLSLLLETIMLPWAMNPKYINNYSLWNRKCLDRSRFFYNFFYICFRCLSSKTQNIAETATVTDWPTSHSLPPLLKLFCVIPMQSFEL